MNDLTKKKDIENYIKNCNKKIPIDENSISILRKNVMKKLKIKTCINRSKKEPHNHQKIIVNYMMKNRGLIVYHKVGSGKTLTAILVSQCFLDRFPYKNVIVITPAGLLENFKKEMMTCYKNILYKEKYLFYSYNGFSNLCKNNSDFSCKNSLVIIDEGHNLRTPFTISKKGKITGLFNGVITDCAQNADKVLLLTGTPLYNSQNDIVPLYNMIKDPKEAYETEKTFNFNKINCKISYYDSGKSADFPKRVNNLIPLVMDENYLKKYNQIIEDIGNETDARNFFTKSLYGDKDLAAFYNAVRRAVNNLEDKNSPKIKWVIDKIVQNEIESPVIVFSHFLDAGNDIIAKQLKSKKIPYAYINGSISMEKRKKIVQDYNNGLINVLLISKAGGEGLDLKKTGSVILLEPSWNESTIEQVVGRAIRYKSHAELPLKKRVVNVYYLDLIKPTDQLLMGKKVKDWLKDKNILLKDTAKRPFKADEVSIDFFLRSYIKKKQNEINEYNKLLIHHAIENNIC